MVLGTDVYIPAYANHPPEYLVVLTPQRVKCWEPARRRHACHPPMKFRKVSPGQASTFKALSPLQESEIRSGIIVTRPAVPALCPLPLSLGDGARGPVTLRSNRSPHRDAHERSRRSRETDRDDRDDRHDRDVRDVRDRNVSVVQCVPNLTLCGRTATTTPLGGLRTA